MRIVIVIATLICGFFLIGNVATGSAPNRPVGIAAKNWIQIGDGLGFVVVRTPSMSTPAQQPPLVNTPPVQGYFEVRTEAGWQRAEIVEAPLYR